MTAAIDLAFSLIETGSGQDQALRVARLLVVLLDTSEQADIGIEHTRAGTPIDKARKHILENPRADLGLNALAEIAGVSPRHLSRQFRAR